MQEIDLIFSIAILLMSVIIHEVSHGFVAYLLGDRTAKYAGRLTLNPLKHIDLIGSILLPIISYISGGFIFGWAKPVPFNPYNLKNPKTGAGLIALSGPVSNFLVAGFFGLIIRNAEALSFLPVAFFQISVSIVMINSVLGIFNLIPIPPLDGSKVLFAVLPESFSKIQDVLERIGFVLVLFFIFYFSYYLQPVISYTFRLFVGAL